MKKFIKPEIEFISFENEDIVTCSTEHRPEPVHPDPPGPPHPPTPPHGPGHGPGHH